MEAARGSGLGDDASVSEDVASVGVEAEGLVGVGSVDDVEVGLASLVEPVLSKPRVLAGLTVPMSRTVPASSRRDNAAR